MGLPIASLMGDGASATKRNVRSFLRSAHSWLADCVACSMTVEDVVDTAHSAIDNLHSWRYNGCLKSIRWDTSAYLAEVFCAGRTSGRIC